jgi:DNA helicase-2/ATP-dependent DNA helicase PcrA
MSVFELNGRGSLPERKIDYASELNQEQLDVVLHGDGPCLVLAGAGSGKTRTVTYRVAYLLEQGVDPSQILLLTFTNKAAREMVGRLSTVVGDRAKGVWGGTFHSIANRLLRHAAQGLGFTNRFTILDQEDAQSLVKAVMKDLSIDPKARRFPTANVVHSILSFATNTRTSVSEVLELKHPNFQGFANEIEEINRMYADRKRAANAMDFDDLLVMFLKLLSHPDAGRTISEQFQYILVDEYQDTNALQAEIVDRLASVHRNVVVVGDDAQSIYAFRGADVQNILSFPKEHADGKIFKLLMNYRSAPEILDLANASLSHNTRQFQKELVAVREKGSKPVVVSAASARQEAQFIAEQILVLRNENVALPNIAVLFRSSAQSQALEFELMSRDIPYEYRGGMRFFERAHIKDALSYIRIAANPQDEPAWIRVLNLQTGIGATTASAIISKIRNVTSVDELLGSGMDARLSQKARIGWGDLSLSLSSVMDQMPSTSLMIRAILESGYRDMLEREYPDWRERLEDVEQLAAFAESYTEVAAFLSDIALYDEALSGRDRSKTPSEERVVLSTVHQAKGLEWDTVFVIHLADNAFPNRRAMTEEGGLEEERRLFYVAVTRARRKLFLSYPLTMGGGDSFMLNMPSTFIEELPPYLYERMELRDARGFSGRVGSSSSRGRSGDDWSFEGGYEEPVIRIDQAGERSGSSSATVWKSSSKKLPPTTYESID